MMSWWFQEERTEEAMSELVSTLKTFGNLNNFGIVATCLQRYLCNTDEREGEGHQADFSWSVTVIQVTSQSPDMTRFFRNV